MDNLLETLTKKQMLRRSVGFSAGYDLQGPLDNLLATLDNKADVAEVGGPERTKVVTMDIAGEGFDCLQVFDLTRSLETSWTRLDTANNLKLPRESGIWDVIFGTSKGSFCISMLSFVRPAVVSHFGVGPVAAPVEKRYCPRVRQL